MLYKCPYYVWDNKLIYGSGCVLYLYNYKDNKLVKRIELFDNIHSIFVDQIKQLILLGCDDKTYVIYDFSFNLLSKRKFNKKISFVTKFNDDIIVGDYFGDVSLFNYATLEDGDCSSDNHLDSFRGDKALVPYSHYSTITASLVHNDTLFTGDKDGKIIVNSLINLHDIDGILLAHKMSISCMDIVNDKLLVSLSIENTIRIWCLSTCSELLCINLPVNISKDDSNSQLHDSLRYNLSCNYTKKLIIVPYLNHLLVIQFDFDKLELTGDFTFKLPFIVQASLFIGETLYLIDEYSSLYYVELNIEASGNQNISISGDVTDSSGTSSVNTSNDTQRNNAYHRIEAESTNSNGFFREKSHYALSSQFSTNRAVKLSNINDSRVVEATLLYDDQRRNRGVKINITKHVNV